MPLNVKIENIEEMRRRAGIDDVVLREDIGRLQVGDHVNVTFLSGANPRRSETMRVRITKIEDSCFHGKLASDTTNLRDASIRAGTLITFTRGQIHSIPTS